MNNRHYLNVLRQRLVALGYQFRSATDTEVAAHLIHWHVQQNLAEAGPDACLELQEQSRLRARIRGVRAALDELQGSYALVILFCDMPQLLLAARRSSPLVIGVAADGHLIGSDLRAVSQRARRWMRLNDDELAVVRADSVQILKADFSEAAPQLQACVDDADDSDELGDFPHFTLKEIYAQPTTLRRVLESREQLSEAFRGPRQDRGLPFGTRRDCPDRILIVACGTSWHASLFGKYIIEELAGIPVAIEYASEFRYRVSPRQPGTLLIAVSQSGETADTVGALRDFQACRQPTLAICNVPRSTLAQEADGAMFLHVGTELGVAATKSYTAQCAVFVRLAIELARAKACLNGHAQPLAEALARLPDLIEQVLESDEQIRQIAERFCDDPRFLFVGRGYDLPTALEGALKLKEISYIHAEGYAAGELKHGPLALVDEHTPTVALATPGRAYEKMLSNLQEIRARGGAVIAVAAIDDERIAGVADEVIRVPVVEECLQPLINIVPLQLLAYHIAVARGCDVDRPRNLAKSVTVE
ncbi:MAG: glutamine--fructose-6-phosphate transaminase (isomerizing) [Planctomycetota bacterium]|nr:glutamine--fructose-6-phosphate transaminase (isomerizing) [Planctomycetota bacterium]